MFSPEAMAVLRARYLKDRESPEEMFHRVASHVARAESRFGKNEAAAAEEFYRLMSEQIFLPNSPALINADKPRAQLAACFVLPVEDSLEGIFDTLKNTALIHQSGGGTGFSFSRLRGRGELVSSTGGVASGPVSFLQIYDIASQVVKQGAVRRGANMAILRVDHPDIEEFIVAKRRHDVLNNFNLSVGITDRFMEAVKQDGLFDLVNPHSNQVAKTVKARDVFELMVKMAWQNGEPGLFFLDTVNTFNPTPLLGNFEAPNPCSEQPLLPYESCVLGSINLTKLLVHEGKAGWQLDYNALRGAIRTAVRFLDNMVEINDYPLPQVAEATLRTRKIGLGIMGLADSFILLDIPYASRTATELTVKIMQFVTSEARAASSELGKVRGNFPAFAGSIFAKQGWDAMRNATVTTIAPTGSISILAGCSSGIEPLFALAMSRHVLDGQTLVTVNKIVVNYLSKRNLFTKEVEELIMREGSIKTSGLPDKVKQVLATAHEISPHWHVAQLAAAQRHTDNGVSKTVNMPSNATEEEISRIYCEAFDAGCKGVTVYRDASRPQQVLTAGAVVCEDCCKE